MAPIIVNPAKIWAELMSSEGCLGWGNLAVTWLFKGKRDIVTDLVGGKLCEVLRDGRDCGAIHGRNPVWIGNGRRHGFCGPIAVLARV